ncbi:MAG: TIGR01212 family radical SAM protein [Acidobacteriota bacterium]
MGRPNSLIPSPQSTISAPPFLPNAADPIHWISKELKARFGGRVRKASLDTGATCPNRDGTLGVGGCAYCDPSGSGPGDLLPGEPWAHRLRRLAARGLARGERGVIAYFQAYTATYGVAAGKLEAMLAAAFAVPGVIGLALGARPDCLPAELLAVLERWAGGRLLWVELGMQSRHDATLRALNRGHDHASTVAAVEALRARRVPVVLHLILGLPGEGEGAVRESLAEAARLRPWGVKLHPLHVVRGSALEGPWKAGGLPLLSREAYAGLAADAIEALSPEVTIHRLTGERPGGLLLAPDWCADKRATLGAIRKELARRRSWQGRRFGLQPAGSPATAGGLPQ